MLKNVWRAAAACLLCSAGLAQAQQNLYLFRVENLASVTTDTANPFYIGNNVGAITLLNGDLYVGGFNNSADVTAPVRVTRLNNVFGSRTFTTIANLSLDYSSYTGTAPTTTLGTTATLYVNSLDVYRRPLPGGVFESRLLVYLGDTGTGVAAVPQGMSVWNAENPAPSLPQKIVDPNAFAIRWGFGGGSWDWGTGGQAGGGIAYPTGTSPRNPVAPQLFNGYIAPKGVDAFSSGVTFNPTSDGINEPPLVYGIGSNDGDTNGPRLVANGEGTRIWRDLWIHRGNGTMVARADNTVVVTNRQFDRYILGAAVPPAANSGSTNYLLFAPANPSPYDAFANNVSFPKYGFLNNGTGQPTTTAARITNQGLNTVAGTYPAGTLGSFIIGQHVAVTEGLPTEYIVWNNRTAGAGNQNFATVFRMNRLDNGATITPNFIGFDGTPIASFPYTFGSSSILSDANSIGFLDFAWDRDVNVLGVSDAAQKAVYFFSTTQPGPCTLPDGNCALLPANVCTSTKVGGTAGTPGAACPSGTCCNSADGSCTFLPRQFCASAAVGGWTLGGSCTPNPCVLGSCCIASTSACTIGLASQCSAGLFTAGVTVCPPAPACPASGSCCVGAACTITFQSQCTGVWTSAGVCTPNPCSAPTSLVCCRGVTCTTVTNSGDCTAPAGVGIRVLDPATTSCTGQSALNTGCCYADFNKSGVKDVADIFAFLSAWFANSPFSDVGGDGTGIRDVSDIFQFLSAWFAGCS
ncbi:MAG: hypothetical protein K2Q20_00730 [Phycisphaerales bacterium]|nr:hypothetical protein [Phycisphaerales bacterium]